MAKRKAKKKPAKRKAARSSAGVWMATIEKVIASSNKRLDRIEEFLGEDLKAFHEKQPAASLTNGPQAGQLVDPE
jgi:hypothetical protein